MARGTISINEDRCKGCELCIQVCPKDLIHSATHFSARGYRPAILVDPEGQCTGCLLCSTICPDVAITVYREKQVTSRKSHVSDLKPHVVLA